MPLKKSKKVNTFISSRKAFDKLQKDSEPVFDDKSKWIDIATGLNWYSHFCEADQAKRWLIDYMKHAGYSKEDTQHVKLSSWGKSGVFIEGSTIINLRTAGFLGRMVLRGFETLPEKYVKTIKSYIEFCKRNGSVVVQKKVEEKETNGDNKPSIQDHIREQVVHYATELEGTIDDFIDNNYESTISTYDCLVKKGIKGLIAKKISNEFQPYLKELELVSTDDYVAESYANMTKNQFIEYGKFIHAIINDCERYSANVNSQKLPRKKKQVSIIKQISKLKYKKQDDEYKIVSINPSEIIGADQLYVFNSKYRKLGMYKSDGPAGLSVKGSTIQGFNLTLSKCKTLRKPESILTKILSGSKLVIKRQYDSIKSKEKDLTGRINNETILLKIIK